jgi:hypothetical protein
MNASAFPAHPGAIRWANVGVVGRVLVLLRAVGGSGIDYADPEPAKRVEPPGHRLKVMRVDAVPDPAEVINLQALGYRANKHLVGQPVSADGLALPAKAPISLWDAMAAPLPAFAIHAGRDDSQAHDRLGEK